MPYNIKVTAENNENIKAKIDVMTPLFVETRKELEETTKMFNGFLDGSIQEFTSDIKNIAPNIIFMNYNSIRSISLLNVKSIETSVCYNCPNLKIVNIPNVTKIKHDVPIFYQCPINNIELPNLVETEGLNPIFYYCKNLKKVKIPKLSYLEAKFFESCNTDFDLYLGYDGVVGVNNYSFNYMGSLPTVHVRSEYADQYATATNWCSLIESGKVTIVGDYSD